MNLQKLIVILLIAPICAFANIKFTIINKGNPSHDGFLVRTPIKVTYMENNADVYFSGNNYLSTGLFSNEQQFVNWNGNWYFSTNAAGNYKISVGCNVDGRNYIVPPAPTVRYLENESKVNVVVECQVNKEGLPAAPIVTVGSAKH